MVAVAEDGQCANVLSVRTSADRFLHGPRKTVGRNAMPGMNEGFLFWKRNGKRKIKAYCRADQRGREEKSHSDGVVASVDQLVGRDETNETDREGLGSRHASNRSVFFSVAFKSTSLGSNRRGCMYREDWEAGFGSDGAHGLQRT